MIFLICFCAFLTGGGASSGSLLYIQSESGFTINTYWGYNYRAGAASDCYFLAKLFPYNYNSSVDLLSVITMRWAEDPFSNTLLGNRMIYLQVWSGLESELRAQSGDLLPTDLSGERYYFEAVNLFVDLDSNNLRTQNEQIENVGQNFKNQWSARRTTPPFNVTVSPDPNYIGAYIFRMHARVDLSQSTHQLSCAYYTQNQTTPDGRQMDPRTIKCDIADDLPALSGAQSDKFRAELVNTVRYYPILGSETVSLNQEVSSALDFVFSIEGTLTRVNTARTGTVAPYETSTTMSKRQVARVVPMTLVTLASEPNVTIIQTFSDEAPEKVLLDPALTVLLPSFGSGSGGYVQAPLTLNPTSKTPTTYIPTSKSPSSYAPTSLAPTSAAPTSLAPTSLIPTTFSPTSHAPTSRAPTRANSNSLGPTSLAPTSLSPTKVGKGGSFFPTSRAPSSYAPTVSFLSTGIPTSNAPTTLAPTSKSPTSWAPTSRAPSSFAPTSNSPSSASPTSNAPTTLTPTTLSPTPVTSPQLYAAIGGIGGLAGIIFGCIVAATIVAVSILLYTKYKNAQFTKKQNQFLRGRELETLQQQLSGGENRVTL